MEMTKMVYYMYHSRNGLNYCIGEFLNEYLMVGDYLLFDSAEECVAYWKAEGIEVDRYA